MKYVVSVGFQHDMLVNIWNWRVISHLETVMNLCICRGCTSSQNLSQLGNYAVHIVLSDSAIVGYKMKQNFNWSFIPFIGRNHNCM